MKVLVVTEKCNPCGKQRDGGARVVDTLRRGLGNKLTVMQFGEGVVKEVDYQFDYPFDSPNRFKRRLLNGHFIALKVAEVAPSFTDIVFIHLSMQFGLSGIFSQKIWTFPMFLTPSYEASGETIPADYFRAERRALKFSDQIITPSYYEKQQLMQVYQVSEEKITVIPRGIYSSYKQKRHINKSIQFCSVGSIKPQKNTLALIELFSTLCKRYPGASLRVLGPIQDREYGEKVQKKVGQLSLEKSIQFLGHIPPEKLFEELKECHIHLSTSRCETFGRSIFETLSFGLPNVAMKINNAATNFLENQPYVFFVENHEEFIMNTHRIVQNYSILSHLATEVGVLYDDTILAELLQAKICEREKLVISDYDGTLFHQYDKEKTKKAIKAFHQYSIRVICSARSLSSLLLEIEELNIQADWIIASSGAIIADGKGSILRTTPLTEKELLSLDELYDEKLTHKDDVLQVFGKNKKLMDIMGLRSETYQGITYVNHWSASKLHAIQHLLKWINWKGQVDVFGDGSYDHEMITFFDGTLVDKTIQQEVSYV